VDGGAGAAQGGRSDANRAHSSSSSSISRFDEDGIATMVLVGKQTFGWRLTSPGTTS